MEPLLEGMKFAIGLEHSSTLSQAGSSSTQSMHLDQVKELLLDVTEMQLLLPRPEPEQDGLAICARYTCACPGCGCWHMCLDGHTCLHLAWHTNAHHASESGPPAGLAALLRC